MSGIDLVTIIVCVCAGGDSGHHFRGGEPGTLQEAALKALRVLFAIKMR